MMRYICLSGVGHLTCVEEHFAPDIKLERLVRISSSDPEVVERSKNLGVGRGRGARPRGAWARCPTERGQMDTWRGQYGPRKYEAPHT